MTMIGSLDRVSVRTASGNLVLFDVRDGTSDAALAHGIIEGREYTFPPDLTGWAIDIGAHIGLVTVALAVDNPDLRIVAVEALRENVEMLHRNVVLNGLSDRVTILHNAAGTEQEWRAGATVDITYGWTAAQNQPDHYMRDNRFIGGMVGPNETSKTETCAVIGLESCLQHDWGDIESVALLKIDCEGCEWHFLTSPAIAKVRHIIGELHHGKHGGAAEFRAMLEPTHDVTMDDSLVVAIFEAVRR